YQRVGLDRSPRKWKRSRFLRCRWCQGQQRRPLERARQDGAASSRSRFGSKGGLSLRTAIAKCRLLNPREPERLHYRGTEWRRKNHVGAGISAEVYRLPKF